MARYYPRYGRSRVPPAAVAACAVLVLLAAFGSRAAASPGGHGTGAAARAVAPAGGSARTAVAGGAAAKAVAYARHRVGWVPYVYGGTTDAGLDCSGLFMDAWGSAGVTIKRTSEDQWASEQHVTTPEAGDGVFFAGGDGTDSDPGHVGIVVNPARHLMIDAYVPGTYVRYDTYGLPSSAPGLSDPVGFTDPAGGA